MTTESNKVRKVYEFPKRRYQFVIREYCGRTCVCRSDGTNPIGTNLRGTSNSARKTFTIVDLTYFTGIKDTINFLYTNAHVIILPVSVNKFSNITFRYTSIDIIVALYDGKISYPDNTWHNSSSATKMYVLDEHVSKYGNVPGVTFLPMSELSL